MSTSLLLTNKANFLPQLSWPAELPLIAEDELVGILASAATEELDGLVRCITAQGKWTCQLKRLQSYKDSYPNHRAYSKDIAAEIQKYGGNTLANQLFRSGKGVPYKEIVNDVARHLKVAANGTTRDTELAIREHLLAELWKKMSESERRALLDEFKVNDYSLVLHAAMPAILIKATTLTGFGAYKASVILANAFLKASLGHGLPFLANAVLTKSLSIFLGPVGWTLAIGYAAKVIGGEAYRVTVPCVLLISMMRTANELRVPKRRRKIPTMQIALLTLSVLTLAVIIWKFLHH
jgi:uncharacterized protein YaaW (UPF0174 family)